MRVHELAKELGVPSKEIIARIEKLGSTAKNHMSQVDDKIVEALKKGGSTKTAEIKSENPVKKTAAKEKSHTEASPVAKLSPSKVKSEPAPTAKITAPPVENKPAPAVKIEAQQPTQAVTAKKQEEPAAPAKKTIALRFPITVGNLAGQFNISIPELIKALMGIGVFANVNQLLNEEIVRKVAGKLGIPIETAEDEEDLEKILHFMDEKEDPKHLKSRSPVVTMMGHVDHGKTSLLDAIRKTNVAAKEKGHITQHIGAYVVDIPGKGHVTFLDTPGHEAFTAMRARGANVTDVVILVVAADDGAMPQTVEAINHAREAGCPIVVAINKIDLPHANPQKVMLGLQKYDLIPEVWGGKTIFSEVSAKTGKGINELLEMLLLEAEVLELKANPSGFAAGTVIESHLSKGSGPVATIIVQKGTLKAGDIMVCGPYMGRVKALRSDLGKIVKEAGPSYAVEVSGLSGVPEAGEIFAVVKDEKTARRITEKRLLEKREREMSGARKHLSLEDLYNRISEGNFKELKIILKADVQGSLEALTQSLEKLSTDQCHIRVIHAGMGGINESDTMLAAASDAIIIGFHVKADPKAEELCEREGVDLRYYNIIYEAVEDVRKAMEGLLEPTYKEVVEGSIQLRKIFKSSKVGNIGGGMVVKGKVMRGNPVRLLRDHVVVFEGKIDSLKRFKDDVREVAQGFECGISLNGFNDLQEGDIIESYRLEKIAPKLQVNQKR